MARRGTDAGQTEGPRLFRSKRSAGTVRKGFSRFSRSRKGNTLKYHNQSGQTHSQLREQVVVGDSKLEVDAVQS
jgi:hypothetical protein